MKLCLTPVNINDCAVTVEVLSSVTLSGNVIPSDNTYGTVEIRDYIETNGTSYCISPKTNSIELWECDFHHYKARYVVEYFFNKVNFVKKIKNKGGF